MTNGGSVHLLWMAMLMGGCGGAPEPEAPVSAAPERTSVLLVVVDTLRADHTTPYGHDRPTTPFFSSLASQSIVYERAYSTAPWTKPSIAALLTSRYPTQLGLVGHPPSVPDKATLLAEHFSAAGYATGAVVSHTYVGSKYGFQQGFDTFDESQVAGHVGATAKGVTDTAIAWLDEHGEGPFFLLAHYFDPHFAYLEREGFPFSKSEGYDGPIRSAIPYGKMRKLVKGKLGDADVDELLRLYDTEIAATDRAVGRLVDHVRRKLGRDDAVVVVTADHGEEFLDHGRWGHTTRLYEELLRVPLIIHYPDHRAGRESTPVSLVDVAPTVLAAAGLPVPDEAEGVDLGAGAPPRAIFAETASDTRRAAIVSGDLKAIWDRKSQGYELYDLAADPLEKTELSATRPDDLARLSTALQAWTQRIKAERLPTEKTKTSDEERSMLQELGYVAD